MNFSRIEIKAIYTLIMKTQPDVHHYALSEVVINLTNAEH